MGEFNKERGGLELNDGNLIKIQDKNNDGKVRISIYDGDERKPGHSRDTINIDTNTGTGTIESHNGDKTEKESTDISCALTNACIAYQLDSFKDDCYELTTLRWFRDNFLSKEDIKHYYNVSPEIVTSIMKLPNSHYIFKSIYIKMVLPSINAIENNDYQSAYNIYQTCMADLERKYINQEQKQRLIRVPQTNNFNSRV